VASEDLRHSQQVTYRGRLF